MPTPPLLAARIAAPCPGLAVLYCNTVQPFLLRPVTIQYVCIAIQVFSAFKPASVPTVLQYNCQPIQPIAIQSFQHIALPTCNTITVLQYNSKPNSLIFQYNPTTFSPVSCNTIPPSQYKLGSSKFPNFCTKFFFLFFFIINIYIYIFFHYFQQQKKITKIIFFSFSWTLK